MGEQTYNHVLRSVDDLTPYAGNSRTHSQEQINQIAASILEFGFTNPLLIDSANRIIAGHGRLIAAIKLKMGVVPCVILDGLTEAQLRAYVIADNQLALNAGWDYDLLRLEIADLKELDFNIDLLGFDDDFFNDVTIDAPPLPQAGEESEKQPDFCVCPHCNKQFDLNRLD